MTKFSLAVGAALGLLATVAQGRPETSDSPGSSPTWWGSAGGAVVAGSVDVPCAGTDTNCFESGGLAMVGVNFTYAGPVVLRLRAMQGLEATHDRQPYGFAALTGFRLGNFYPLIGAGWVKSADSDYQGNGDGLAVELLYARKSRHPVSFELSVSGHISNSMGYLAVGAGARFGKLR